MDEQKKSKLIEKAEAGDIDAMLSLIYVLSGEQCVEEAQEWTRKAIGTNDPKALYTIGRIIYDEYKGARSGTQEYMFKKRGVELIRKASDMKYPDAMYEFGRITPNLPLMQEAADKGSLPGILKMIELGSRDYDIERIEKAFKKAPHNLTTTHLHALWLVDRGDKMKKRWFGGYSKEAKELYERAFKMVNVHTVDKRINSLAGMLLITKRVVFEGSTELGYEKLKHAAAMGDEYAKEVLAAKKELETNIITTPLSILTAETELVDNDSVEEVIDSLIENVAEEYCDYSSDKGNIA